MKLNATALLLTLTLFTGAANLPAARAAESDRCPGGFDATFIQLSDKELRYGAPQWRRVMRLFRSLGISLIVLQYSGRGGEPYYFASRGHVVKTFLAAAAEAGVQVLVGLHEDKRWPNGWRMGGTDLPPPLADDMQLKELAALCTSSPAFAGWYIPQEPDDRTWSEEGAPLLRSFLLRTTRALREVTPKAPIAIAPYFSGDLSPEAHAKLWKTLLQGAGIDIVILQDGVGTRRAGPKKAGRYLSALAAALKEIGVRAWSAFEIFQQTAGVGIDERAFRAKPASISRLTKSLGEQRPLVERVVAFAVLNYMDPARSSASRRLHREYKQWCEQRAKQPKKSAAELLPERHPHEGLGRLVDLDRLALEGALRHER